MISSRWISLSFFVLTTLCLSPMTGANAAESITFPSIQTEDLNGTKIDISKKTSPEKTVILMAFEHAQRDNLAKWADNLKLSSSKITWFEMPVIDNPGSIVRAVIRAGMGSKISNAEQKSHICPVFTSDKKEVLDALKIDNEHQVYIYVLDRHSKIIASAKGPYSPELAQPILKALK